MGFLNMQRGRREQKWGELFRVFQKKGFDMFSVVETHLPP